MVINYFDFQSVKELIYEEIDRAKLITSNESVPRNRFRTRIEGFVIQDTVNNPLFPFNNPILDKGKGYLSIIYRQYIAKYQKQGGDGILPWHFFVEYSVDGFYNVYNTRPINLKFPFDNSEIQNYIKNNNVELNENFKLFETSKDMSEMISIIIVGDSNLDVYTKDIYKKIGTFCIGPFLRNTSANPVINDGIFLFNIGKKFSQTVLIRNIKKL